MRLPKGIKDSRGVAYRLAAKYRPVEGFDEKKNFLLPVFEKRYKEASIENGTILFRSIGGKSFCRISPEDLVIQNEVLVPFPRDKKALVGQLLSVARLLNLEKFLSIAVRYYFEVMAEHDVRKKLSAPTVPITAKQLKTLLAKVDCVGIRYYLKHKLGFAQLDLDPCFGSRKNLHVTLEISSEEVRLDGIMLLMDETYRYLNRNILQFISISFLE